MVTSDGVFLCIQFSANKINKIMQLARYHLRFWLDFNIQNFYIKLYAAGLDN